MRLILLFCLLSCVGHLRAELLQDALRTFPANTVSWEYDNLRALRRLPNYKELRQQYSGEALVRAKQTLLTLGISEDQLTEVVTATGPGGFFGLIAGTFPKSAVEQKASEQNFSRSNVSQGTALCSPNGMCVFLAGNSAGKATFGSLDQIRALLDVREDRSAALEHNSSLTSLLKGLNEHSPVVGFAPGSEIGELINGVIPPGVSSRLGLSKWFADIQDISYNVDIDSSAHLNVNILCKSETESKLLSGALNAAGNLQRLSAMAGGGDSLSFRNLVAAPAGPIVHRKLDASLIAHP